MLTAALSLAAASSAIAMPEPIDPSRWITNDDYPAESRKKGETGIVGLDIEVDPDGKASRCRITRPTGFPRLDVAACSLAIGRARFKPARGHDGQNVWSIFSARFRWALLPTNAPALPAKPDVALTVKAMPKWYVGQFSLVVLFSDNGELLNCNVLKSKNTTKIPERAVDGLCRGLPALNDFGRLKLSDGSTVRHVRPVLIELVAE